MQPSPRHRRAGFSLIELMAVVTIIVILAGLVVGGLGFVTERQAKEKAKVQMALISKALEEYKLDNGTYPATGNTDGSGGTTILYQALYKDGVTSPTTKRIYLPELNPTTSKQGWTVTSGTTIIDPWGKEYRYRTALSNAATPVPNALTQNPDFDLWSVGKDGGTNPNTPSDTKNRDDIKNF